MKKEVHIIGGGSAALFLAAMLPPEKFRVHIYEKNKALGRKFLVAGQGGFNLTHSEPPALFKTRYREAFMGEVFLKQDNSVFRNWLKELGVETVVGSSRRVYPVKGMKPIEVLNAIEKQLEKNAVLLHFGHMFCGWDAQNHLIFEVNGEQKMVSAETTVLALGGGSWRVTGSDGSWAEYLVSKGIRVKPFQASNCAFKIAWPEVVKERLAGKAIKNAQFTCGNVTHAGEAVITAFGIEGSGVYPLSEIVRKQLEEKGTAYVQIDFKPQKTQEAIKDVIENKLYKNTTEALREGLKLSDAVLYLLKTMLSKEQFLNTDALAKGIKHFQLEISELAPLDEAISTVGGIDMREVSSEFELKKMPGVYAIGEMLDWDAPTGGYLLQMCFSMAAEVAGRLRGLVDEMIS
jgi:uncharacterized flavoprotein (TIGR03862 family)